MKSSAALVLLSTVFLASCAASPPEPEQDSAPAPVAPAVQGPEIVVSNSILGSVVSDIVECAIGDSRSVTVLMPLGTDPHDFQPSSEQVATMVRAEVVVANGLGLETGLEGGLQAAREDGALVLELAPLVDPLEWSEIGEHDHEGHDHGSEEFDPHFWMDMSRMALAAGILGDTLAEVTGDDTYAECGVQVGGGINDAEADVIEVLAVIEPEKRLLVTGHESLGYFAARYDFEVIGVVIPGGSTLGAPDSQELARLVDVVRDNGVSAIFGNSASNPAVLEALAQEAGGVDVVELYIESAGPEGSGAEDYAGMMLENARLIADALSG